MTKFGLLLNQYLGEMGGTQEDFADRCGVDGATISRIRKGQKLTRENFRRIVACLSDNRPLQANLVAAHVFDYLPSEFHNLVEIRKRADFSTTEAFQPPRDEFQAALSWLHEHGEAVEDTRSGVISLFRVTKRLLERVPNGA